MKHFNLSSWAVSHPALILFLMIVLGAAGFFSYEKLGRAEDPFFTVKVVNVSAIWPVVESNGSVVPSQVTHWWSSSATMTSPSENSTAKQG